MFLMCSNELDVTSTFMMFAFRNFEQSHVGQIKTVYSDAYELRQEKGLSNAQGIKLSGYQLTVEARLEEDSIDPGAVNSKCISLNIYYLYSA